MIFDGWTLTTLILGTTAILWVAYQMAVRRRLRVKIVVMSVVFFLYSGYGLATMQGGWGWVVEYFGYLVALLFGTLLASGSLKRPRADHLLGAKSAPDARSAFGSAWWSPRTSTILACVFLVSLLGQVVVAGQIASIFNPESVFSGANKGEEIFSGRLERSENPVYSILSYARLLTTPFLYVELQRRLDRRWFAQLAVVLLVAYLQVVAAQQWGRAALLLPFLTWGFILLYRKRVSGQTTLAVGVAGSVVVVPLMNWLFDWRSGVAPGGAASLTGSFQRFAEQELTFPHRLSVAEGMGVRGGYAEQFLAWFVTLPIPRSLTGTAFSVSQDFSETALGLSYGEPGFYVLLPSWLGESIIGFGPAYYWVWPLLVGIAIGATDRLLSQSDLLVSFDAYITAMLIFYMRGVSQEFLAQTVNSMWVLIVLFVVARATRGVTSHGANVPQRSSAMNRS